jgi:uncharacterized protein (TIGR00290 family)
VDRVVLAWSGGKDSALALHRVQKEGHEVVSLLTTVTHDHDRISMHGVRRELLERQVRALGLPLHQVDIGKDGGIHDYEDRMREAMMAFKAKGITKVVFGDIHLEDVRSYREDRLSQVDMTGVFPLWGSDPSDLARGFVDLGFKAVVTCVDTEQLGPAFAGRKVDHGFLSELPAGVDLSGESGEYHTFVYDGPIFKQGVRFRTGEMVLRDDRFQYCDLLPE